MFAPTRTVATVTTLATRTKATIELIGSAAPPLAVTALLQRACEGAKAREVPVDPEDRSDPARDVGEARAPLCEASEHPAFDRDDAFEASDGIASCALDACEPFDERARAATSSSCHGDNLNDRGPGASERWSASSSDEISALASSDLDEEDRRTKKIAR